MKKKYLTKVNNLKEHEVLEMKLSRRKIDCSQMKEKYSRKVDNLKEHEVLEMKLARIRIYVFLKP